MEPLRLAVILGNDPQAHCFPGSYQQSCEPHLAWIRLPFIMSHPTPSQWHFRNAPSCRERPLNCVTFLDFLSAHISPSAQPTFLLLPITALSPPPSFLVVLSDKATILQPWALASSFPVVEGAVDPWHCHPREVMPPGPARENRKCLEQPGCPEWCPSPGNSYNLMNSSLKDTTSFLPNHICPFFILCNFITFIEKL